MEQVKEKILFLVLLLELVLEEVSAEGVLLVEWPERSAESISEDYLHLTISPGTDAQQRTLVWAACGARSRALLVRLRE